VTDIERETGIEVEMMKLRCVVSLRVTRAASAAAVERFRLAAALTISDGEPRSLWMSPEHWLLMSDSLSAHEVITKCDDLLVDLTHNAVDYSDALAGLRLSGGDVRELLSSGCALDFRPASFPQGACQLTRFAQIAVAILASGDNQYDLFVDRSYASYVTSWLKDSITICRLV